MVHSYNSSTWEVEAGKSLQVQGQPGIKKSKIEKVRDTDDSLNKV